MWKLWKFIEFVFESLAWRAYDAHLPGRLVRFLDLCSLKAWEVRHGPPNG